MTHSRLMALLFVLLGLVSISNGQPPTPEQPIILTPVNTYEDAVPFVAYMESPYAGEPIHVSQEAGAPFFVAETVFPKYYTLPTGQFSGPLTGYAYFQRQGFGPSATVSRTFQVVLRLDVQVPTIGVTYDDGAAVITMTSTTPGLAVLTKTRYRIDDATPIDSSTTEYFGPITLTNPGTYVITAHDDKIIRSDAQNKSATISRTVVVAGASVPTIVPDSGQYAATSNRFESSITCVPNGCEIFYTTDNSEPVPDQAGTIAYTGTIVMDPGIRRIKAISRSSASISARVSRDYSVTGRLDAPVFVPPSGSVLDINNAQVEIQSAQTANAWYIIRGKSNTDPLPPFNKESGLYTLLQVDQTIALSEASTVHVTLDLLYYTRSVNVSSALYELGTPGAVVTTDPGFNPLWLLWLVLLIPLVGCAIAYYCYRRRRARDKTELAVFDQLGFDFAGRKEEM